MLLKGERSPSEKKKSILEEHQCRKKKQPSRGNVTTTKEGGGGGEVGSHTLRVREEIDSKNGSAQLIEGNLYQKNKLIIIKGEGPGEKDFLDRPWGVMRSHY